MQLRFGLLLKDLEFRFKISSGRISRIFKAWIQLMCQCLQTIVILPPLKEMKAIPLVFWEVQRYSYCLGLYRSICLNSFISTKSLIGIDKIGVVVFVSRLWGGSVSDNQKKWTIWSTRGGWCCYGGQRIYTY